MPPGHVDSMVGQKADLAGQQQNDRTDHDGRPDRQADQRALHRAHRRAHQHPREQERMQPGPDFLLVRHLHGRALQGAVEPEQLGSQAVQLQKQVQMQQQEQRRRIAVEIEQRQIDAQDRQFHR